MRDSKFKVESTCKVSDDVRPSLACLTTGRAAEGGRRGLLPRFGPCWAFHLCSLWTTRSRPPLATAPLFGAPLLGRLVQCRTGATAALKPTRLLCPAASTEAIASLPRVPCSRDITRHEQRARSGGLGRAGQGGKAHSRSSLQAEATRASDCALMTPSTLSLVASWSAAIAFRTKSPSSSRRASTSAERRRADSSCADKPAHVARSDARLARSCSTSASACCRASVSVATTAPSRARLAFSWLRSSACTCCLACSRLG